MVVVGIIALLGVIITPGFKKVYQDFLLQKTLSDADTLLQSWRSYYLIYNEIPGDTNGDYVIKEVACFLPSNLFKKTETVGTTSGESYTHSVYQLAVRPFNDSTFRWDFDNWITWDDSHTPYAMCLSFNNTDKDVDNKHKKKMAFLELFEKRFPLVSPQPSLNSYWVAISIPFPEFPLRANLDTISPNRFY